MACLVDEAGLWEAVLGGDNDVARHVLMDLWEDRGENGPIHRTDVPRIDSVDTVSPLFHPVRDYWLKVGLSTDAGRPSDEWLLKTLADVYREGKLSPPRQVIRLASPLHGAIGAVILGGDQVRDQVGDQVRDQVWDQVEDQVRAQVGDQVRDQVGDQVRAQVGDQVRDQVGDQVRDQVWDQVGDQVGDQVRDQVGDQVRAQVWDQVGDQVYRCGYGTHDASWLAFYHIFDLAGLLAARRLRPLMALSRAVGWWWPFEDLVIVTPKPAKLEMKDNKLVACSYEGFVVK